jgi:hypothetical protein
MDACSGSMIEWLRAKTRFPVATHYTQPLYAGKVQVKMRSAKNEPP